MKLRFRRGLARACEMLLAGSIKDRLVILTVILLPVVSWRAYPLVATWSRLAGATAILATTFVTSFLTALIGIRIHPPKPIAKDEGTALR